ncbi:hypothetical protein RchiOBHm_Chr1g0325521 [Rosa chinensis]|nr:hypothetical protein RchiOBHm_Chr1g0325521 [Rosa chinensis]
MLFHILMLQYLLIVYLSYKNCNLINQQFFLVYSRALQKAYRVLCCCNPGTLFKLCSG